MPNIRFGQIDLDTSHPAAFAGILTGEFDGKLTAICDSGDVMTAQDVQEYADRFGSPEICKIPSDLVGLVDIALIHSVNWDRHRPAAEPLIQAGIPIFIDKPLAGNMDDCRWFVHQQKAGALIYGCSSIPY